MSSMFMSIQTGTVAASPLGGYICCPLLHPCNCSELMKHTNAISLLWLKIGFVRFSNDIALLKLSSPVSITSYVKLASLPSSGQILPHNNVCYLTGYGRTSSEALSQSLLQFGGSLPISTPPFCLPTAGGGMPSRMRQVLLRSVDHQTCTSSGWWGSTVKTNMICAGGGSQSGCNVSPPSRKLWGEKNATIAGGGITYLGVRSKQRRSVYQQLNKSMTFRTSGIAAPVQTQFAHV